MPLLKNETRHLVAVCQAPPLLWGGDGLTPKCFRELTHRPLGLDPNAIWESDHELPRDRFRVFPAAPLRSGAEAASDEAGYQAG